MIVSLRGAEADLVVENLRCGPSLAYDEIVVLGNPGYYGVLMFSFLDDCLREASLVQNITPELLLEFLAGSTR